MSDNNASWDELDFRKSANVDELMQMAPTVLESVQLKYIYFTTEKLQQNLQVLDKLGVQTHEFVEQCVLGPQPVIRHQRVEQIKNWPMHVLPKVLPNLERLSVYCDVKVHFIEKFAMLKSLSLHGSITATALAVILERCTQLTNLKIVAKDIQMKEKIKVNCQNLRDLNMPLQLFISINGLAEQVPKLENVTLKGSLKRPRLAIMAVRQLVMTRQDNLRRFHLNCSGFKQLEWVEKMGLHKCKYLCRLTLSHCYFPEDVDHLAVLPQVTESLALWHCTQLQDYQLINILERLPQIRRLYLTDCPNVGYTVLYTIYFRRKSLNSPITIIIGDDDYILQNYKDDYEQVWHPKESTLQVKSVSHIQPVPELQLSFSPSSD